MRRKARGDPVKSRSFHGVLHGTDRSEIRRHFGRHRRAHPGRRASRRAVEGPRPSGRHRALRHVGRDESADRAREGGPGASRRARARRDRLHRRAGDDRPAVDGAHGPRAEGQELHRGPGPRSHRQRVHQGADREHRRGAAARRHRGRLHSSRRGLPGHRQFRQPHHARPRRVGHFRGRACGCAQGRRVPDLHRRGRRLHHGSRGSSRRPGA